MRVLSIDIGVRNLAHCLLDTAPISIVDWDVLDLTGSREAACACGKPATYGGKAFWCDAHKPAKLPSFKSASHARLVDLCRQFNLPTGDLLRHSLEETLLAYKEATACKALKVKVAECTPVMLAKELMKKYAPIEKVDLVLVENQIGPLAARMKALQGMVIQYWVMRGAQVEIVSSANKLKGLHAEKTTYAERKKLSIHHTREITQKLGLTTPFDRHKKKDDLADTFLQAWWYLTTHKIIKLP